MSQVHRVVLQFLHLDSHVTTKQRDRMGCPDLFLAETVPSTEASVVRFDNRNFLLVTSLQTPSSFKLSDYPLPLHRNLS